MEFLEIVLLTFAGYYIWRSPEKQRRAEILVYCATCIMFLVWFVATKSMILPAGNY